MCRAIHDAAPSIPSAARAAGAPVILRMMQERPPSAVYTIDSLCRPYTEQESRTVYGTDTSPPGMDTRRPSSDTYRMPLLPPYLTSNDSIV
ncbi:hypothetical protein CENSYa_0706 [Cenarchaeum symbiosum A]|uniref:Uncharacterized protein n=1 Tax=Cenarchaeum symbiosum (strain A) TaxID=414004 RepID=A0RVH2_CENSY|nr:hypothetical protein CENSYa_0706 [Cenarchaeum symbiosum A]